MSTKQKTKKFRPTEQQLSSLTAKERDYYDKMKAKEGVLYITSRPGEAKSSIARSVANKLGMQYFDVRLSMVDETEVGGFPVINEETIIGREGDDVQVKVLDYAIPKWAVKANQKPSIIHFEELNRASLQVRNAALQMLLERCIGTEFQFNNNVLMITSGNLGEDDGTDVEEFDAALNNRLIHVKHIVLADEWLKDYATKTYISEEDGKEYQNVIAPITAFIKANPEYLYKKGKEEVKAYATHRSWTFLSAYIRELLGEETANYKYDAVRDAVVSNGSCYIGTSASKFQKFLDESLQLNIEDVLKNFDKVEDKIKKANRDKKSELLQNLKEKDISKMKSSEVDNVVKFLKLVNEDECVAYLTFVIDGRSDDILKTNTYKKLFENFVDLLTKISSLS